MYIVELIIKFIRGKKYKKITPDYDPENNENIEEKPDECEHFFMPLDDSNEFFACKYCGIIINAKDLGKGK
jgi:hypothetical protein